MSDGMTSRDDRKEIRAQDQRCYMRRVSIATSLSEHFPSPSCLLLKNSLQKTTIFLLTQPENIIHNIMICNGIRHKLTSLLQLVTSDLKVVRFNHHNTNGEQQFTMTSLHSRCCDLDIEITQKFNLVRETQQCS